MKGFSFVIAVLALTLLAASARAEIRSMEMSIFGMD
jgi:hypothetical protein